MLIVAYFHKVTKFQAWTLHVSRSLSCCNEEITLYRSPRLAERSCPFVRLSNAWIV